MDLEGEFEEEAGDQTSVEVAQWDGVCEALGRLVSKDAYQRWFRSSRLVGLEDGKAVVAVPNEIHQLWIEANYMPELASAVAETIEGTHGVKLVVEDTVAETTAPAAVEAETPSEAFAEPEAVVPVGGDISFEKRLKSAGLNHNYTFGSFVVGANSQFAHAACEAVARVSS